MKKYLIAFTLAASLFATSAHAQVVVNGNFTWVEVDILSIVTRPASNYHSVNGAYALHVVISTPLNLNCMSATTGIGAKWPIIFSDRTDFKLVKDTLFLAYTLKKKVRIYAGQCANFSQTAELGAQYPIIYGVDTL